MAAAACHALGADVLDLSRAGGALHRTMVADDLNCLSTGRGGVCRIRGRSLAADRDRLALGALRAGLPLWRQLSSSVVHALEPAELGGRGGPGVSSQ